METKNRPIKVAQMTDLHFSPGNLAESSRTFGFAVTRAIEDGVDAVLITGDSTDHAMDAHAPAVTALALELKRLADADIPVLMLQGTFSHEPVGFLELMSLISEKILIADRIESFGLYGKNFEVLDLTKPADLVVHALPTLNKGDIAATVSREISQAAMAAGEIIADVLAAWAPLNRKLRADGVPSMVISHGTVVNCKSEHGVPMAGQDHEFGVGALFAAEADVVALGHIHFHQSWETDIRNYRQVIAYGGSIGRFHYGELGEKVFLKWNMIAGASGFDAIPTPAKKTVDIFFDGPPDMEELREAAKDCDGAFVRVRYEVDEEHRIGVDRAAIKEALAAAGAAEVQIEGKTLIVERSRAAGISNLNSVEEKLVRWGAATETKIDGLIERLTMLQNMEPEAIVKKTVDDLHQRETMVQNTVIA